MPVLCLMALVALDSFFLTGRTMIFLYFGFNLSDGTLGDNKQHLLEFKQSISLLELHTKYDEIQTSHTSEDCFKQQAHFVASWLWQHYCKLLGALSSKFV